MSDLERRFTEIGPVSPPLQLDQAVEQMIEWAELERRDWSSSRRLFGVGAIGCMIGLLVGGGMGFWLDDGVVVSVPERPTVIVVEPTPELYRWITGEDQQPRRDFFRREHGELETLYVVGDSPADSTNSL